MSVKSRKFNYYDWLLLALIVALVLFLAFYFGSATGAEKSAAGGPAARRGPPRGEQTEQKKVVLRSQLAGSWYPADEQTLRNQIKGFFQKAETKPMDNVIALILPHAGYQYSGQTAAFGLKTLQKKYKRIVVIGPSHYVNMEDVLSVPRQTHYETPLGQIPLDTEFIDELLKHQMFQSIPRAHEREHSVQIELPLLQYCQSSFKVVPIVAGACSLKQIRKAAAVLRGLVDNDTLVIASSDFTHYGSRFGDVPFTKNIPEEIKKLDLGAYEHIAAIDCEGFLQYKQKTGATICGYIPIAILLSMLEVPALQNDSKAGSLDDSAKAHLLCQTSSGEIMGDFNNSVSYLSIAFCGGWQRRAKVQPTSNPGELSQQDKEQLLTLARKSLVYFLEKQQMPEPSDLNIEITAAMSQSRAAFVTLNKPVVLQQDNKTGPAGRHSALRGCIGDIFPQRPLYKSVILNAILAGVKDRRFPPVTRDECDEITIEISALTVPQPAESAEQIRVGTDGVVLSKDGRSAVFLPQVAPEQGWDLAQMLQRLSLKAGLPADAWKQGAGFLVFQAEVFGEPH